MKTAFIFPGQGAQYIGMGKEIAEKYPSSAEIFSRADSALGFGLTEMIFNGTEGELSITENTQPAVLTVSVACLQPLLEAGVKPAFTAGLSLGEYTAHVMSGTFTFEDAVKIVRKRGKLMQEAVPAGKGATAAIIALDNQAVADCCAEASKIGIVQPTNYNCPGQLVIAGETAAVEKAMELCRTAGAKRALMLPVSAPFHCSLLKPAGVKLAAELEELQFNEMKIPLVSNVTSRPVLNIAEAKELLVKQVSSPVLWEDSIRYMLSEGVDTFIEIGPGKALCGFLKRIAPEAKALNVENIESLEKTLNEIVI